MTKHRPSLVLAQLLVLSACFQPQLPSFDEDVDAIKAIFERVVLSAEEGDLEGYLALYTDDAVWMFKDRLEDAGKEEVRQLYRFMEKYSFDQEVSLDEIVVAGDWAFVRLTADGWLVPKPGVEGDRRRAVSRHLTIAHRQTDGSWKLARDIYVNPKLEQ
jgi:uncharacterized protein (TIGR02246 family)